MRDKDFIGPKVLMVDPLVDARVAWAEEEFGAKVLRKVKGKPAL